MNLKDLKEMGDITVQLKASELAELIESVSTKTAAKMSESLLFDLRAIENPPKLIDTTEACNMLGVSRITIHNYKKKGLLKPIKLGNKVKYLESEVLALKK